MSRGDAERNEVILCAVGPPFTESEVVFNRPPFITMAFDLNLDIRMLF